MKKTLLSLIFLLFTGVLFANESKVCQKWHPIIYDEYYESSHRKASIYNNPIHEAVWKLQPKDEKKVIAVQNVTRQVI